MNLKKKEKSLLEAIIEATNSEQGFEYYSTKTVQSLIDAGLVEQNPEVTDPNGALATRATQKGIEVMNAPTEANGVIADAANTKQSFAIASGIAIPTAKRGGRTGSETYPFDQLEQGASFFVPATEDRPNPAKSIASTVTSANERYSEVDPSGATRTNRKGNVVPVTVQTRKFEIRAMDDGAPWGFPGVKGAGVWRTL